MASAATYRFLIVLFSTATLLSVPATARPCKTLVITSYSFNPHFDPNNNLTPTRNSDSNSNSVTISIETSTFSQSKPRPSLYLADRRHFSSTGELERPKTEQQQQPRSSLGFGLFDMDSLRDRAKDILEVVESLRNHAKDVLIIVVPLLLVVSFGAFTCMTVYLVWLLYAGVRVGEDYSEANGGYDAIESPKKMGYVAIPPADSIPSPTRD